MTKRLSNTVTSAIKSLMNWKRGVGVYGTPDQPMYQREWQPCQKATAAPTAQPSRKPLLAPQSDIPDVPDVSDAGMVQAQEKTEWLAGVIRSARTAQICRLRSDRWQRILQEGVGLSWQKDIQEFRSQSASAAQYDQYLSGLKVWFDAHIAIKLPSRADCAMFAISDEMARLDKIEWNLSGGYH